MDELTRAEDIALPTKLVTLLHLKKRDGSPVVVLCESVDELTLSKIYGMPGERPLAGKESDPVKVIEFMDSVAPSLVHAATAFAGSDGRATVRPAFHFDDAHAVSGSIPGRFLRVEDKLLILNAILENSGLGGAADSRFSAGDGEGEPRGVGALEDVAGDGDAAASHHAPEGQPS
jgi:hypothetical protein